MNISTLKTYMSFMQKTLVFAVVMAFCVAMPIRANAITKYRWPLGSQTTIQNWDDHDSRVGNGGTLYYYRYDCQTVGGYDGHTGTDTGASYGTSIYNGAIGTLYYKYTACPYDGPNNGYPTCGGGLGNHVRMQSNDGKVAIYAHMKYGSPTNSGSYVCSVKVGEVGSSGNSEYYHLHFELWSNQNKSSIIDPFSGNCSQATSYWVNQNGGSPTVTCQ
jgi:murein DD-endopeptidase MepM/ murein hydrolase activator NlpD